MKKEHEHKASMLKRLAETLHGQTPMDIKRFLDRFLGTPEQMEEIDKEHESHIFDIGDKEQGMPGKKQKRRYDFI